MTVRSGCVCLAAIVLPITLAAAILRAQPATTSSPAPASPDKPRLILVTQSKDFVHDVVKPDKDGGPSRVVRTFNELAQKTNLFTVETTDDVTTLTPEKLKQTKLIAFYTTGDLPFTDAGFAAFEQWIKDGGGFLGIHCATDTLKNHPIYPKLIGGIFDGHPWDQGQTVTIKVNDPSHPACKPFPADGWTHQEEIYQFKNFDPATVQVLMSLDMEKTEPKKPHHVPVAWCKDYGRGKVFYTSLGHRDDVWTSDVYQQHLTGAIRWLLNLDKADATPNPDVSRHEEELAQKAAGGSRAEGPLPTVAPGFTLTTFAEAPDIHSPVSIAATPDGRLFVAEDEYNSGGPRDPGLSRVKLSVDTDGDGKADKFTTFAEKLNSPQGMCYVAGTLYVTHAPFFTAFRDTDGDGIADRREDLITGLGPVPEGLVHHVPSGVHLGIDGWLYITIGDKGIVAATGKDGRRVGIHGGGIVRIRPDGTELEVFCTGTRNIFDVALDPYLNAFTRDNTNDGDGWNSRLSPMQRGGGYGYPNLFRNFGDEIVPPIDDYGMGGATGSIYVHEPGFPSDYGDTLYTTDWAKSMVYRHKLTRNGTTFKATSEDFIKGAFATHEDVDGESRMYVADWSRRDWSSNKPVGAVYLVSAAPATAPTTGPTSAPSLPAFTRFPDMTKATLDELVEQLASPSAVRQREAQQELLHRGNTPAVDAAVKKLMLSADRALHARVAAVFTLAQLMGPSANKILDDAANDPVLREFALRAMTDRDGQLGSVNEQRFVAALKDTDPRVREQAAIGIGRIGKPQLAASLVPVTADDDLLVRHAAQQSLRRLVAWPACTAALSTGTLEPVVAGALRTLRDMHDVRVVDAITKYLAQERRVLPRREAVKALARLYQREAAWDGKWWMTRPDTRGPNYQGENWDGTRAVAEPMLKLIDDPDDETQRLAVNYAGIARVAEAAPALARIAFTTPTASASDKKAVDAAEALRQTAAQGLIDMRSPAPAALDALEKLATSDRFSVEVRGKAAAALGATEGKDARAAIVALLTRLDHAPGADAPIVEKAADGLAGRSVAGDELSIVLPLLKDARQSNTRAAVATALLRSTDPVVKDAVAKLWTTASPDQLAALLTGVARVPADDAKPYLPRVKEYLKSPDDSLRHAAIVAVARADGATAVPDLLTAAKARPADATAVATAIAGVAPDRVGDKDIEPAAQLLASSVASMSRGGDRESYSKVLAAAQRYSDDKRLKPAIADRLRGQLKQTGVIYTFRRTDPIPVADAAKTYSTVFPPEQTPAGPFGAFTVDGKTYDFKPATVTDPRGLLRLDMPSHSVVYLTTTVDAKSPGAAVLSCGSDDGIQIWLNGKRVIEKDVDRGLRADSDKQTVPLIAGTNVLLIKLNNHIDGSGVEARVRSRPPEFDPPELVEVTGKMSSNPDRGRELFSSLGCVKCHTTDPHEDPKGPFLGEVGSKFDSVYLAESILHPSAKTAQGFGTTSITARDEAGAGTAEFQGFIVRESGDEVQLRDLTGKVTTVPKARIVKRAGVPGSMMPEGLADSLTLEDFRALLSYLESLKAVK